MTGYGSLFSISSHDGQKTEASPVSSSVQIAEAVREGIEMVAIDEAQFLDPGIVRVANVLADLGVRVIVAGTSRGTHHTRRGIRELRGPVPSLS